MHWLPVFPFGISAFQFKGAGHFGVPTVELCPMMRFIQNHVSLSVRAGLALFGAVLLWSSSLSSLVALMLLRVTVWRRAEAPMLLDRRVTRREWKYIVLLALCEPCFYFVFEGYAMIYTTASQAGMVVAALPLAVVVAAWLLLGERLAERWIRSHGKRAEPDFRQLS